jgi:hypothetical protein
MGRGKKRNTGRAAAISLSAPRAAAPAAIALSDSSGLVRHLTPADIGKRLAETSALRDLVETSVFERDRQKWKAREKSFTDNVAKQLQEMLKEFASSEDNWRQFIKIYARAPHYSMTNMWWAWAQLARKGVDSQGMVLSETGWKALGRLVKPEYKRSYKQGEDGRPAWDDNYAAEMTAPMVVSDRGTKADDEAKSAKPQNPAEAAKMPQGVTSPRRGGRVIGYKVFDVYHEAATESKDGSELPKASWYGATGSDEDAAKLWADIEKVCDWQDINLVVKRPAARTDPNLPQIQVASAAYDRATKTLTVYEADTVAAQSVAALSAICDHFGPESAAKDDNEVKSRVLARESAAFALASLYGLQSERQAFAFLADVAQDDRAIKRVSKDVHDRVSAVLAFLDPVMRLKVRGEADLKGKYEESRAAKRAKQRKAPKGARHRKSALAG